MSKEQCGNCKFYWREDEDVYPDGECPSSSCRRYPPAYAYGYHRDDLEIMDMFVYPEVQRKEWCGEWRPVNGS